MYFPQPGYNTIIDIDENIVNNSRNLNRESSRVSKNGNYMFPPIPLMEGLSGYEKQQIRKTILDQEAIFQRQLHELHRIFRRQLELTNQMHYEKLKQYKDPSPMERENINLFLPRSISSPIPTYYGARSGDYTSYDSRRKKLPRKSFDLEVLAEKYVDDEVELWNNGLTDLNEPVQVDDSSSSSDSVEILENSVNCSNRELQRQCSFASSNLRIQYLPKEFPQNSQNGIDAGFCLNRGKELPSSYNSNYGRTSANGMPVNGGSHSVNSSSLFKSLQYDPSKAHEPFKLPQFDQKKSESQRRNKLFGVDISKDGTDMPLLTPSSLSLGLPSLRASSSIFSSEKLASISSLNLLSTMKDSNGPHSFNEKFPTQITEEKWISKKIVSVKGKNRSDKLYEGLPWLNKPIIYGAETSKEKDKQKIMKMNDCRSNGMILGKPVLEMPTVTKTSSILAVNGDCSTKNVSFNIGEQFKDDATVARSERNSHIDLNMCLDELDLEGSLVSESLQEEFRIAAEAILAISSDRQQAQAPQTDDSSLHWFADIISSFKGDIEPEKGTFLTGHSNKVTPKFDYFEFMTLRLTETKVDDQCYYKPPKILETNKEDEETTLPKRPRRGQGKRGKQLKDFQKDVLPSIASLSRYEVTEDFQTIEGIIRTSGGTWESSLTKRNAKKGSSRGRRRAAGGGGGGGGGGLALVSTVTTALPIPTPQQASPNKSALEEQSLAGWGKKTRRQKCPIGNSNSPLLVK